MHHKHTHSLTLNPFLDFFTGSIHTYITSYTTSLASTPVRSYTSTYSLQFLKENWNKCNRLTGMEKSSDDVSKSCELKQPDRTVAEASGQLPQDEGHNLTPDDAIQYLAEVKSAFTSEKYDEFIETLKNYNARRIDIPLVKMRLMELIEGDTELLKGLNIFLPKDARITFAQENEPSDVVMQLVHKIKMGLQDDHHLYASFLGILNSYRMGEISPNEVHEKVSDLLQGHQDLITEFTNFLPHNHAPSIDNHNTRNEHASSSSTKKTCLRLAEEETMAPAAEQGESGGQPDPYHEKASATCREKGKRKRSSTGGKPILISKRSLRSRKDKNKAKLFQDLDLDSESCNPSYQLVQRDQCEASQRSDTEKEVLNDEWVSVSYEREGHSFKPSLKNQYEKALFLLEDNRFELDMGLERVKTTIKQAEELADIISDESFETNGVFPLENYFSRASLRCIEVIYGNHGRDIINALRNNVSGCLPVIVTRLKQKQEEWMMFHSDLDKISGQIFIENHQLSLDHHGLHLKQQDTKSLCDTALLAEINKISEARSRKNKVHQLPHLDFKYSDMDIHGDIFQLVKLSGSGIFSSIQLEKVLKMWTSFVEPLFGFVPRPECIDASKHIAETSHQAAETGSNGAKEDEQIMNTGVSIDTDSYLDFLTNEIDFCPIVDLEKGGFAACIDDRMEVDHTPKQASKQNYHNKDTGSKSGNEANADALHIFYGDDVFYIFFRLHQALYSRLLEAKEIASEKWRSFNDSTPNDSYARFLDLLHNYLANREKHEAEVRACYVTWTGLILSIERLIKRLSKQLLAISINEVDNNKLIELFVYEKSREPGRFVEEVYAESASMIVNGNKIFRFEQLLVADTEGQNRFTVSQINFGEKRKKSM